LAPVATVTETGTAKTLNVLPTSSGSSALSVTVGGPTGLGVSSGLGAAVGSPAPASTTTTTTPTTSTTTNVLGRVLSGL
jgi:hypothetical protein